MQIFIIHSDDIKSLLQRIVEHDLSNISDGEKFVEGDRVFYIVQNVTKFGTVMGDGDIEGLLFEISLDDEMDSQIAHFDELQIISKDEAEFGVHGQRVMVTG